MTIRAFLESGEVIEIASTYVDEPIRLEEVDRYSDKDRRLWTVDQWLRRADRWWRLRVRRRPYSVLLPGRIDRQRHRLVVQCLS